MLRKIVVIACLFLIVGFSLKLALKSGQVVAEKSEERKGAETVFDFSKVYAFSKDTLTADCSVQNEQLCAVENAVKCTINPNLEGCSSYNLPKFIFMQNPELDRPTEMSYKIINKKTLVNDTAEIYTDSVCNGGWFGLCQGTVIYVLTRGDNDRWFVKDIYAIE